MKKPIILFDLDGTLIDSTEAIVLSFYDTFENFSLEKPKREDIVKNIGHTLEDMFISLDVEDGLIQQCVSEYKKNYRKRSLLMTSLLPGAKEAIELAYSFARLGIVTTKTGKYSKEILEHLGVMRYFEVLIGREDVFHPKPHKEPIEKALHYMNTSTLNVWMIGDTVVDMLCAESANVQALGVLSGYASKKELSSYADTIKENALEAVKYILQNYTK